MPEKNTLYLLLGANLGDRMQTFLSARILIESRIGKIFLSSSVYETAPWGVLDQPSFLNQVIAVETNLAPAEVLFATLEIEKGLGRERHERWAARVIDIDILYYNRLIYADKDLTIPHPRLHERRFTLSPLVEIAPLYIHPILKKTNQELLVICQDDSAVTIFS